MRVPRSGERRNRERPDAPGGKEQATFEPETSTPEPATATSVPPTDTVPASPTVGESPTFVPSTPTDEPTFAPPTNTPVFEVPTEPVLEQPTAIPTRPLTDDGPRPSFTATPTGTLTPVPSTAALRDRHSVAPAHESPDSSAATAIASAEDDDSGPNLDGLEGFGIALAAGAAVFMLAIIGGIFVAHRRPVADEPGDFDESE